MRKLTTFLLSLSILFFLSCSKESDDEKVPALEVVFTCEIDGVSYDLKEDAEHYEKTETEQTIKAMINDSTKLLIVLPVFEVGEWTKASDGDNAFIRYFNDYQHFSTTDNSSSDYQVTITSIDQSTTMIKGTFSGKLYKVRSVESDTREYSTITNGKFEVLEQE